MRNPAIRRWHSALHVSRRDRATHQRRREHAGAVSGHVEGDFYVRRYHADLPAANTVPAWDVISRFGSHVSDLVDKLFFCGMLYGVFAV
jgi:hypothetical protein